ncbi:hypothetical protein FGF1_40080 [Flavobacteriaceae bacterium GF1]
MATSKRLHYLDWLRVLAFGLLFLFHSWRPFDHMPWHIKNEEQSALFDLLTFFTHGWRMHLIFLVSGVGTWFAMRSRKGKFLRDRLHRLIVPFLMGIVLIIPPQRFYEWLMFQNFEGGYLEFMSVYPGQQLGANMGANVLLWFGHLGTHLWYLPYLFTMTLICIPIFQYIQKGKLRFTWLTNVLSTRLGVFVLVVPMIVCRFLLKPLFPVYTDWADFFVYLWPFVYGFLFMADAGFVEIIKRKTTLFLIVGSITSLLFLYMGSTNEGMVQAYMNPEYGWLHLIVTVNAMLIAWAWVLFFLGFFAKSMDFQHRWLVPANIGILPIYILHQTLIIVFGYYIVAMDAGPFVKFVLIFSTAIPVSILLYQLIRTNRLSRFLFGLKPLTKRLDGKRVDRSKLTGLLKKAPIKL